MHKNLKIYNEIKTLYDNNSTANYIMKHVKGINEEFNEYFKNTELDISTTFGNKGNAPEKIYAYLFGITYCPICKKKTKYRNRVIGYNKYCEDCGKSEGAKHRAEKLKQSSNWHIEKFICKECGKEFEHLVKPNNKNQATYSFCSASCRCSYMHKHMSKDKKQEIAERKKKTCIEKYGTEYVVNSDYTRQKTLEKIGYVYPQYQPNYGELCKNSYKRTHNGKEFHHTEESKRKMYQTKLEKYGPLLSTIKNKTYIFPSGKKVYVQGYENYAIDLLLKEYSEDDIIVERKNIKNEIGKDIMYIDKDDCEHVYFPDIYIKSKNLIIEVKSKYTYNVHKEINEQKRKAVIDNGINFSFMIIELEYGKLKKYTLI